MSCEKEMKAFCNNIRILRITNGLPKKEMCVIMKIGIKTLNKLENGEIPPRLSADILYYVGKHFDLRVSDLFYEKSE